ncbi:MAG: redox-regulated ATPase YchF [Candidatus Zambryskibacteria bacterium RIFOXYC1_FULL_39_10]|uniref:Ribosome-binding ATPase YchF n=1 Tax=Candidatus Zambryskibacteria bacterium RIFOXYC1_FULL_39_10 TaxID=1802779 RepID=A0A1G2UYG5_9BACT|nr:MAG: redox-regulated ATPase YchF [Candidatus Zambryskibacteria bacterium RIFOXYC1_FULL_39_10]OHB16806.1 MAG: redox-regulated ATPase YchF [Candidatus Zambryskibacteria bacterium RIFOXYD1_FULL_39_35]
MNISCGIVGLPNVGKSTLFNALTKKSVPAENYPFCTIDPSVGIIAVPDERLEKLNEFSKSKKKVPAVIEFVDIAGLVKGASKGEGKGNEFLRNIRECDAIAQVVRIFDDPKILHVEAEIDPLRDIQIINLELILKDLETVSKRLGNLEKDLKRGDKEAVLEASALGKVLKALENEKMAITVFEELDEKEKPFVINTQLLTSKPILYVLNKKAGGKNLDEINDERFQKLIKFFEENNAKYVLVDANIENELKEFEGEEKESFRKELGADSDGVGNLIISSYELLGLETFFTTGEDETRGWTIKKNSTAPEAGRAIHNDFKEKFIRAEVIPWDTLLQIGSYASAREKGLLRTEGKEYIVKDGDVVEFRI